MAAAESWRGEQRGADESARSSDRLVQGQPLAQAGGYCTGEGAAGAVCAGGFDSCVFPASNLAAWTDEAVDNRVAIAMTAFD